MSHYPTQLAKTEAGDLLITWSDGQTKQYGVGALRKACPCATCREKHGPRPAPPPGALPVLSMAEAQPLQIARVKPVGNYAYGIAFSDGHDTGIYTLELLHELGEVIPET